MDSLLPLAKKVGEKLKARKETVGVSESSAGGLISAVLLAVPGASGPTGNSYGDPAGHTCVAVVGPKGKIARTLRTGSNDRVANMRAFAAEALKLLDEQLG